MLDIIVAVSISVEEVDGGGVGGLERASMSTVSVFSSRQPPTSLTVVV